MSSVRKLFGYFFLLCVAAAVTHWAVRHNQRANFNPQETGLEWMRSEYGLDDGTFAKVQALHEKHFAECRAMTDRIEKVDRPLLSPPRRGRVLEEVKRTALKQDEALCSAYEAATLRHLREVAALMPARQAERFLNDFAPSVQLQRIKHQQALSEKASK